MTRYAYIEQIRRLIYNGQPSDDATITVGLVNVWLDQAIAFAAKQNYKENIALDGIEYVNNSFYTTFKNLEVENDNQFVWKITLPHIPFGLGTSNGVSTLVFKDFQSKQLSQGVVWLSANQKSYFLNMRTIPNKILAWSEGEFVYVKSTIVLSEYTAQVAMVSGGDSTDLYSTLNVPADYLPVVTDYISKQLLLEKAQPLDATNDGSDFVTQT